MLLNSGISMTQYVEQGFDEKQLEQIELGLQNHVDVSLYAHLKYDWKTMFYIRYCLENGLNITRYVKNENYTYEQLFQIYQGLKDGLNVPLYSNPNYSALQMDEIRRGLKDGLDAYIYAKQYFNWMQMYQIRLGLGYKLDVSIYAKSIYEWEKMYQIMLGLKDGLDVSSYADPSLSLNEMVSIRLSLEGKSNLQKTDSDILIPKPIVGVEEETVSEVDKALNKYRTTDLFSNSQLLQLRFGLEKGVDVRLFADPKLSWRQMFAIRTELEHSNKLKSLDK